MESMPQMQSSQLKRSTLMRMMTTMIWMVKKERRLWNRIALNN